MKKFILLLCCLVNLLCMTGCGDNASVYSNVNDEITLENIANNESGRDGYLTSERYLNWCINMKWYAIPIIIVSVLVGIGLVSTFRKEKKIQRTGLFVFIIGVPAIVFVVVYFACFLYGKLF